MGIARVRVRWADGYVLEDDIQNGIALLFGARDALQPADRGVLDHVRRVIEAHLTLIDER
jgi:hypothetical protein